MTTRAVLTRLFRVRWPCSQLRFMASSKFPTPDEAEEALEVDEHLRFEAEERKVGRARFIICTSRNNLDWQKRR